MVVVGAGRWGRVVASRITSLPGLVLAAVVDPSPEALAAAVGLFSCAGVRSVEELPDPIGGAVVASPPGSHGEVASRLLERGIPTLVEKPLDLTLEAAEAAVLASLQGRTFLQPAFQERWNPGIRACGDALRRPRYLQAERLSAFTPRILHTDVILDLMIHDLDLCVHLVGEEVAEVSAVGIPVMTDQVDLANARLQFSNGAVANLTASRVSPRSSRTLRLFGPLGYHSIDLASGTAYRARRLPSSPDSPVPYQVEAEGLPSPPGDALGEQLLAFARACRRECQPAVSAKEGIEALRLALRVREAVEASARGIR